MEYVQRILIDEPLPAAAPGAADAHSDKAEEAVQGSALRSPSSWEISPHVAAGMPCPLPKGCALGIPVLASFAATPLPQGKALLSTVMGFVQRDDYHAVMELARRGCSEAVAASRRCGFALALEPEGSLASQLPSTLKVRSANLLHYAVCIGSFRAAAALLVVNPALLKGTCIVTVDEREEAWSASELARLFCVLYEGGKIDAEVLATSNNFERALRVLEVGETHPAKLPYASLPTVAQRVRAAGIEPAPVLAALFAAAEARPALR
jgi:hypothetical protein